MWIGHRHREVAVLAADREDDMPTGELFRNQAGGIGVDGLLPKVGDREFELQAELGDDPILVENSQADQHPSEGVAVLPLGVKGALELSFIDQVRSHQPVAESSGGCLGSAGRAGPFRSHRHDIADAGLKKEWDLPAHPGRLSQTE
jgi:hypothetical protein